MHRSILYALATCAPISLTVSAADMNAADASMIYTGEIAGDQFGRSVVIIGDIDGDGHAEFAVGSRGNNPYGTNAGRVTVYSGATGLALHNLDGESPGDQFSESMAAAGDVDGDGLADLIVGAWANGAGGAAAGRAYVYSAATGAPVYTFTGAAPGDNLGDSVAGAGDVNGDGFDDVIVGSPTHDMGASNTGMAQVFSGADGSVLWTFHGENTNDRLGVCVAGIGDLDGDGHDDVAAGAPLYDGSGFSNDNRGRVYVYSGRTGALLYTLTGEAEGDNFGWAVCAAGDADGDGLPDLAVGAPLNDALGSNTGRVYLYSGPDGAPIRVYTGEAASDKLGLTVSPAGDVDHDGFDDLLTGAWWFDIGPDSSDNRGRAYVFSGRTGEALYTITGEHTRDHLGRPAAGGIDINEDGTPDVLIGARDSDANGEDSGRAYLFFLPTAGCIADLAEPFGVLDLADLSAFVSAFVGMEPAADVAPPLGVFDLADLAAFVTAFIAGCP